jgi:hypothetical protein
MNFLYLQCIANIFNLLSFNHLSSGFYLSILFRSSHSFWLVKIKHKFEHTLYAICINCERANRTNESIRSINKKVINHLSPFLPCSNLNVIVLCIIALVLINVVVSKRVTVLIESYFSSLGTRETHIVDRS